MNRSGLKGALRTLRYAAPAKIGALVGEQSPSAIVRICKQLQKCGLAVTLGHFPDNSSDAESVLESNLAMIRAVSGQGLDVYFSIKAPQLGFDAAKVDAIATLASASACAVMFDAHAPGQADQSFGLFRDVIADHPQAGCVLPARWKRSHQDALALRDTSARVRIVKGEWADEGDEGHGQNGPHQSYDPIDERYMDLVSVLAGRQGIVSVATHSPRLAERALQRLKESGTPCELEQLRGLPMRRTVVVARRMQVPVRVYVPFGPGWIPYAIDKALARPYLLRWMLRDFLGVSDDL